MMDAGWGGVAVQTLGQSQRVLILLEEWEKEVIFLCVLLGTAVYLVGWMARERRYVEVSPAVHLPAVAVAVMWERRGLSTEGTPR